MNKTKMFISTLLIAMTSILFIGTSNAASISLVQSGQAIKDCPMQVKIMIDTEGKEINSAGINIFLSDEFIINKFNAEQGIFREYIPAKKLKSQSSDYANKEYLRLIASSSSQNWYKGEGEFWILTITPKTNTLNLELYMVPWSEWEDSSLVIINDDNTANDILSKTNNLNISVIEWECNINQLTEIDLTQTETSIIAENVQQEVEEKISINTENVFDRNQETNRLKKNRIYLIIATVILVLFIFLLKPKKKKK